MKKAGLVIGSMLVVALGCGGSPPPKAKTSETAAQVPGTSKIGHFTTANGMVHLVLDRSGPTTKLKIDGTPDIIELTPEEVRGRNDGSLLGHAYIAPTGKRMLFLGVNGDLTFIKDERDELPLLRDGDGTALGAPTIKGPPPGPKPPEKTPHQVFAEQLAAQAVTKRFPQFKPEDAGNLAKVAEAWQLATADMWVQCNERCSAWYAPFPTKDGKGSLGFVKEKDIPQGPATEQEKKAPLAKYNGWLRPNYEFGDWTHQVVKSSWLNVYQFEFRTLPAKTPAIVWNVDGSDVFIVTLDGSRYWDSPADNSGKPRFDPGLPPVAEWSAPLPNTLLFLEHVAEMNKADLVDKKAADELADIRAKWGKCAENVFAPAQKEIEANLSGNAPYYGAAAKRNNLALRKYNDKAFTDCKGKRAEQLLAEILVKREKEQRALFEKNKARVASMAKK